MPDQCQAGTTIDHGRQCKRAATVKVWANATQVDYRGPDRINLCQQHSRYLSQGFEQDYFTDRGRPGTFKDRLEETDA